MPAATPDLALPYPLPTDYVKDGANDIQALAEDVDTYLQSGLSGVRNFVQNGAFQIMQRWSFAVTTSFTTTTKTHDRWSTVVSSCGTWSVNDPGVGTALPGFRNVCQVNLQGAAVSSPGSTAEVRLSQTIEGHNLQKLAKGTPGAKPLTLSFWVNSTKTGTYVAELRDPNNFRACSRSYTVNAANTWERKTITFPADTSGLVLNDERAGLALSFWLAAGSSFRSGTLQSSWGVATNANRAVGQVNLAGNAGAKWQITGVQLEAGPVATPFEHLTYGDTLAVCLRYYEKSYDINQEPGTNDPLGRFLAHANTTSLGTIAATIPFRVPKRTNPAVSFWTTSGTSGQWDYARSGASGTVAVNAVDRGTSAFIVTSTASLGATWAPAQITGHWAADAEF